MSRSTESHSRSHRATAKLSAIRQALMMEVLVIVYRLLEWDGVGQQPLLTIPTG
jgi:hypothetical protein